MLLYSKVNRDDYSDIKEEALMYSQRLEANKAEKEASKVVKQQLTRTLNNLTILIALSTSHLARRTNLILLAAIAPAGRGNLRLTLDGFPIPPPGGNLPNYIRTSRIEKGLCTYYGGSGYTYITCPNKSVQAKAATLATTYNQLGEDGTQELVPN